MEHEVAKGEKLDPKRDLLTLNDKAVSNWMSNQKPDVVILAAAKVGGIEGEPKQSSRLFTRKSADTNTGD